MQGGEVDGEPGNGQVGHGPQEPRDAVLAGPVEGDGEVGRVAEGATGETMSGLAVVDDYTFTIRTTEKVSNLPVRLAGVRRVRRWLFTALAVLGVQIALGGWVSANYAALSCGGGGWVGDSHHYLDFPKCVGQWWPAADFREGFVLWRGVGVDYEGGILDGPARIAIQMAHRLGAVAAFGVLLALAVRLLRTPGLRSWGTTLAALTVTQVALGILNVKLALPLWVAVAHNAVAALLLFVLVSLLARVREPE